MSDESTVCPKCHVELEFVRDQAYAHGFGDGLERGAADRDAMRLIVEASRNFDAAHAGGTPYAQFREAQHRLRDALASLPEGSASPPGSTETAEQPTDKERWERNTPIVQGRSEPLAEPLCPDTELHARRAHSGYEYATTTGPRKTWDHADSPPPGDGWERNVDAGDEGWKRFEHHEESYWRRRTARYDGACCDPQCNDSTWDHPCPTPPLGWADAARTAADVLLDTEARRSALAEREAGTGALDAAIEAAARAYCLDRFDYSPEAYVEGGRERHIDRDVADTAAEEWFCHMIREAVRAAVPLIPVSEQQRADIERDAHLTAAEFFAGARGRMALQDKWGDGFREALRGVEAWHRDRAASVGTEEGNREA